MYIKLIIKKKNFNSFLKLYLDKIKIKFSKFLRQLYPKNIVNTKKKCKKKLEHEYLNM